MRLRDHDGGDGRRVWLSGEELGALLDVPDDTYRQIALGLLGRSGLRTDELLRATVDDLVDGPSGQRLRVESSKGGHYREPPVDPDTARRIEVLADVDGLDDDEIIDHAPRTIQRWVAGAAETVAAETGDGGWPHVTPHDLRRSWGTLLLERGVQPGLVMEWGGWRDWATFREHYLGEFSPAAVSREREKVDWL